MGKDQVAGSVAWALESSRAASNCGSSAGAVPSASAFRSLDVSLLLFQWEYSCLPGRLAWIKDNTRNLACSVFGTCHALPWQLVCIAVDVTQWWPWGARGVWRQRSVCMEAQEVSQRQCCVTGRAQAWAKPGVFVLVLYLTYQTSHFCFVWTPLSHLYSEDVGLEKCFCNLVACWDHLESFQKFSWGCCTLDHLSQNFWGCDSGQHT